MPVCTDFYKLWPRQTALPRLCQTVHLQEGRAQLDNVGTQLVSERAQHLLLRNGTWGDGRKLLTGGLDPEDGLEPGSCGENSLFYVYTLFIPICSM